YYFFFSSRRRHTRSKRDWSSDVCSSDLAYPEVLKLVKEMDAAKKVVAAICHAGWVLCSAGILKGRRATSYFTIKDDLINAGAKRSEERRVGKECRSRLWPEH